MRKRGAKREQESSHQELELNAAKGRQNVLRMVKASDHGHLGGALSSMDIVTALYFYKMKVDPENPAWEDRDRFFALCRAQVHGPVCSAGGKGLF